MLVAETRSFRKTAERTGVTQPAVTKAIARLEKELGLTLLQRTRSGADLTEAGTAFLGRARQVRLNLEDAIREASDIRSRYQALLRVGVAPSLVDNFFRRGCALFTAQRPAARFDVTIGLSDQLFAMLRRGDVDLVISSIPNPPPPDFRVTALGESLVAVVASSTHALVKQRRLKLEQLLRYQWILPRRGVVARDWLEGLFLARELPLPVTRIDMNTLTGRWMRIAADTDLLSIAAGASEDELRGAGLAILPLAETQWQRPVGALTRAALEPPALVRDFVAILSDRSAA